MNDLYELLGVKRNASANSIRKAYRKKVMTAHPDVPGGSAVAFNALKLAHDVLLDQERRAYYDSTGKVKAEDIDQGRGTILAMLSSALAFCVQAAMTRNIDLRAEDMIGAICDVLNKKRGELDKNMSDLQKRRSVYMGLVDRFHGKDGDNALDAVVTGTLSVMDTEVRMLNEAIANHDAALTLVKSHSFHREVQYYRGHGEASTLGGIRFHNFISR
jgi:curved DNA-binding protein CbpA